MTDLNSIDPHAAATAWLDAFDAALSHDSARSTAGPP